MNSNCRKSLFILTAAAACLTASAQAQTPAARTTAAASAAAQPRLLGQYGDWGAYAATPGGRKICFALAKPRSATTNPPNRPRDQAYFFITTRPGENVRNEVSLVVGYPLRPNKQALAEVGGHSFSLYTQNDGAWIQNVAEEARLIEGLRRGAELVVKGTSARGTESTDTYGLQGVAQALDRVNAECK